MTFSGENNIVVGYDISDEKEKEEQTVSLWGMVELLP